MKILAIDPGYDRLGIAIVDGHISKPELIHSECFVTKRTDARSKRLASIAFHIEKIIKKHKPDVMAIESLYFGVNQKTAIGVAEARGVVISEAGKSGVGVFEFGPNEIKVAITGYGKSDKNAVKNMVEKIVSPSKRALDDEIDAIAIGIGGIALIKNKSLKSLAIL